MSSSESDQNFEYNMTIIKKFYTQIGQIIEVGEYNDPEELDFLTNYIEKYDEEYDKWYNYEGSENNESEESDTSDTESNSEREEVVKSNGILTIPEHVNDFMSDTIDLSNIILYNNKDNFQARTLVYNKHILNY